MDFRKGEMVRVMAYHDDGQDPETTALYENLVGEAGEFRGVTRGYCAVYVGGHLHWFLPAELALVDDTRVDAPA